MEMFTILKANIKHKKGAFKSIIALTALIVFAFTVTVSNNDNISLALTRSHTYTNTPTFTVLAAKEKMPDDIAEKILTHEQVKSVKITECISIDDLNADGKGTSLVSFFYKASEPIYRVFNENSSDYNLNPEPLKEGEIYVPYPLTSICSAKIGSVISFGNDEQEQKFIVKGFIEEPFLGAAPIGTKRVFISDSDFERIYNSVENENFGRIFDIGITLAEGADSDSVKKELNDMYGIIDNSVISLSRAQTDGYTKIYSDIASKILYIFVLLLTVIAVISICHSISVSIEMEYVNLGVLKAEGFTSDKIRLFYILQYLTAEIIGTAVGFLISIPALFGMNRLFFSITGILSEPDISVLISVIMSILLIIITMLFVLLATRKAAKISPVRAISGGKSEVYFDSRLNLPLKAKPLSFFLGLRQFTSRIKSYGGSVFIVALLIYFMMSVTVLTEKISSEFTVGIVYPNITVHMNDEFDIKKMSEAEQAVLDIDAGAKVLFSYVGYIMAEDKEIQCFAYSRPAEVLKVLDGRMPIYDNEVAVTEISAELLGKKIGDTLAIGGENAEDFIITGTYQTFNDLGKSILITAEGRYRIDKTMPLLGAELSDISLLKNVENAVEEKFGEYIKFTEINETDNSGNETEALLKLVCNILVAAIYTVSIIFAAVVVGMICSKNFIKERTDIGIMRALGFTVNNLRIQFALRFMLVALIGSILGGIASYFFTTPLIVTILRIVGLTQLENGIGFTTFILPAVLITLSFLIFSYLAAKKIKSIEIRELILE